MNLSMKKRMEGTYAQQRALAIHLIAMRLLLSGVPQRSSCMRGNSVSQVLW